MPHSVCGKYPHQQVKRSIFYYNTNRLDIINTQSLDKIEISNNSKVIDSYTFTYDYFTGAGQTADDKRLKLLSVNHWDVGKYSFVYNESLIPNRLSMAQDHWGDYNGQNGNTSLLPMEAAYGFMDGANREVDSSFSQVGILKQINYPTGGFTKFDYEQNDGWYDSDQSTATPYTYRVDGADNQLRTQSFTIAAGSTITSGAVHFNDGSGTSSGGGLGGEQPDSPTIITITGPNNFSQNYYNGMSATGTAEISLSPGTYNISINAQGAANGAYCSVSYSIIGTQHISGARLLGGLRIISKSAD